MSSFGRAWLPPALLTPFLFCSLILSLPLTVFPLILPLPVLHALLYRGLPCDVRLRPRPGDEDHPGRERWGALQVLLPGAQLHRQQQRCNHQQHLQFGRCEQRQPRHRHFHHQRSTRRSQTWLGRQRCQFGASVRPATPAKQQQWPGAEVGIVSGVGVGIRASWAGTAGEREGEPEETEASGAGGWVLPAGGPQGGGREPGAARPPGTWSQGTDTLAFIV